MVKKKIIKKVVTKLDEFKRKKKEKERDEAFEKKYLNPAFKVLKQLGEKIKYESALKKQTGKKIPSLDEHKRKKYKPFTKEHLATFHRLENRSDILKPKKIKRKKGEINIIALPPKKFGIGGGVGKAILAYGVKKAEPQIKTWLTENPMKPTKSGGAPVYYSEDEVDNIMKKISTGWGLKQGGVIKKVKEYGPAESKKLRKSIQKVKSKKTTKKKLVTGASEVLTYTKLPEKLSSPRSRKLGYHVTPTGGGIYFKGTGIDRAGRKTTLKSGKLSVSKKGKTYGVQYGPHLGVTKKNKNINVRAGRLSYSQGKYHKSIGYKKKGFSASAYQTPRGKGFYAGYTWKFKEGGVVPNKKGEFIAIGCGKVMGNRRKTTKIR